MPARSTACSSNPVYAGLIRYKGNSTRARTSPWCPWSSSTRCRRSSSPTATATRSRSTSSPCGTSSSAPSAAARSPPRHQRGHVYYRCTHGKGRELCHEQAYTREELLLEQVESILDSIQLGEDLIAALRKEALKSDAREERGTERERKAVEQAIAENKTRTNRLLDSYLDNLVDQDTYQRKARELGEERLAFEQRRVRLGKRPRRA